MPDEVNEQVIQLAKREKRSKSAMAALLIEDGLKLVNSDVTTETAKSFAKKRDEYLNSLRAKQLREMGR